MTDVDYCSGVNCHLRGVCQRYADYLYRLETRQDIRYAREGVNGKICEQFVNKNFYGN